MQLRNTRAASFEGFAHGSGTTEIDAESTRHLSAEALFRQHAGFVARLLTRLGVPSDQLDDALQDVFLVAHRNGGYRPGLAKPTSYLATLAIRAAAKQRRKLGVARQRHSEATVDQMPGEIEDPARALQMRQDLRRLERALEQLPEELRTPLVLVEFEGASCVSVAAGFGCPVGTIYWRLHQARKELSSSFNPCAERPARSRMKGCAVREDARIEPRAALAVAVSLTCVPHGTLEDSPAQTTKLPAVAAAARPGHGLARRVVGGKANLGRIRAANQSDRQPQIESGDQDPTFTRKAGKARVVRL